MATHTQRNTQTSTPTRQDRPELITIEGLTKVFFTDEIETHALSGVHLNIARGEYLAMSGPSGCGK